MRVKLNKSKRLARRGDDEARMARIARFAQKCNHIGDDEARMARFVAEELKAFSFLF